MTSSHRFALVTIAAAAWATAAPAAAQGTSTLADLSLEQLSGISVTSVGKRSQRLSDVAGSVYVIRGEDIRRAGATTLPDALRLAPNLQVAQVESTQAVVAARSGADILANKMLVLLDGRTVYSPLFSGVFWEALDTLLADVDRIEVLSGSGGTLYGSNAFHGVINIITKSALETGGGLLDARLGTAEKSVAARVGRADEDSGYRLWAKRRLVDATRRAGGGALPSASQRNQAGFRWDRASGTSQTMVHGAVFDQHMDDVQGTRHYEGAHVLGRHSWLGTDGTQTQLQAYADRFTGDRTRAVRSRMDTIDVELQQQWQPHEGHDMVWGAGYRAQSDEVVNHAPTAIRLQPTDRRLTLWNAFAQDDIRLGAHWTATLGVKAEHNSYTGLEWLPGARLAWRAAQDHLVWAAASRVVRTPARVDRDVAAPPLLPSPDFRSEVATIYEIGWRGRPTASSSFSATLFHHDFSRLRSFDAVPGGGVFANSYEGLLTGVEAWGEVRVSDTWRVKGGLLAQRPRYARTAGVELAPATLTLGNDVRHQWSLSSSWDLPHRMTLDVFLRHVGPRTFPAVDDYTALDLRWGWAARPDLELSLALRNLTERRHVEWATPQLRAEIARSALVQVMWRY